MWTLRVFFRRKLFSPLELQKSDFVTWKVSPEWYEWNWAGGSDVRWLESRPTGLLPSPPKACQYCKYHRQQFEYWIEQLLGTLEDWVMVESLSGLCHTFQIYWVPWRSGSLVTWWNKVLPSYWGRFLQSLLHFLIPQFLTLWAHTSPPLPHLCQERRNVAVVVESSSHQFLPWLLVVAILHYSLR